MQHNTDEFFDWEQHQDPIWDPQAVRVLLQEQAQEAERAKRAQIEHYWALYYLRQLLERCSPTDPREDQCALEKQRRSITPVLCPESL